MTQNPLFSQLLGHTYNASATKEPIERYFASMFADYYSQTDSQPSCTFVQAILQEKSKAPRKLLQHYRDSEYPRCPRKLAQDLSALADCCFVGASKLNALRNCLTDYLEIVPQADKEDLLYYFPSDDLIRLWTVLTWYALCGDHHG